MKSLDISSLKRNPDKFKNIFKIKDDITLVSEPVYVMFPSRYVNKKLAYLSTDILRLVGIYAILDESNNYTVVRTPIYQDLNMNVLDTMTINGDAYYIATFYKDDVFLTNNKLVMMSNFIYELFDEFITKGNIPWYLEYEDVVRLFNSCREFTGSGIGDDPVIFEILTSTISRDPKDKTKYFRLNPKGKPAYVGLNDVRYGFDNTGARLIGGYFKDGIVSSIVDPERKTSETSKILRS